MVLGREAKNHERESKMNEKIKFIRRKLIMTTKTNQFKVVPVAGRIGGEIQGVQLSKYLDLTILNEIKQALNNHKVYFQGSKSFRRYQPRAFAKLPGELYAHPTVPVKDNSNSILEPDFEQGG